MGNEPAEPGMMPENHTASPAKAGPVDSAAAPKPSVWRRLVPVVILLVLIANGGLIWWHQDSIRDWAQLRSYHAPDDIAQLSSDTAMTDYARRLFFVNKPLVEERDAFNDHCREAGEQEAAVLGCFIGDRRGIFLYNVVDERLSGVKEVTAAHEMLHQAYMRLSTTERDHVNGMLEAYAKTITDQKLKDKLDLYQKTEPGDVTNEMHSIFGTEVTALPQPLEDYYRQYFKDRAKVVAYHLHYRAAFDERTAQIAAYDAQLAAVKTTIDQKRADLDSREKALQSSRVQLDRDLAKNDITAYNAGVAPYNAGVVAYKQAVTDTNATIARYNQLIDERNAIAVEERDLLKAQDSQSAL